MNKIIDVFDTSDSGSAVFTVNSAKGRHGMLGKVVVYAAGATAVATIYDNASTSSGKRICKLTVKAADYQEKEEWPNGLEITAGLFLLLTGTSAEIKIERIEF